jgi:hypothetical protein
MGRPKEWEGQRYHDAGQLIGAANNHHPNIMTPEIVRFGWINPALAYELSRGRGMYDDVIFGVTFARQTSAGEAQSLKGISKGGISETMALRYLARVREYFGDSKEEVWRLDTYEQVPALDEFLENL